MRCHPTASRLDHATDGDLPARNASSPWSGSNRGEAFRGRLFTSVHWQPGAHGADPGALGAVLHHPARPPRARPRRASARAQSRADRACVPLGATSRPLPASISASSGPEAETQSSAQERRPWRPSWRPRRRRRRRRPRWPGGPARTRRPGRPGVSRSSSMALAEAVDGLGVETAWVRDPVRPPAPRPAGRPGRNRRASSSEPGQARPRRRPSSPGSPRWATGSGSAGPAAGRRGRRCGPAGRRAR